MIPITLTLTITYKKKKHLRFIILTKINALDGRARDTEVWRELKSDQNI